MSDPKQQDTARQAASENDAVNEKIQQYNKVVRLAKLSSILLEKTDFKILPEAISAEKSDLKRELDVKTNIISFDPAAGGCVASIVWSISIKLKRKQVVKCSASYIVVYDQLRECLEDAVHMFIDNVGKTATYAYFRSLYAQLDWAATLGSPPLPVLQFQPKPRIQRTSPEAQ